MSAATIPSLADAMNWVEHAIQYGELYVILVQEPNDLALKFDTCSFAPTLRGLHNGARVIAYRPVASLDEGRMTADDVEQTAHLLLDDALDALDELTPVAGEVGL